MAAAEQSCHSAHFFGRVTVPTPCLGPIEAPSFVCFFAARRASPRIRLPRPAPPATAARHRQGNPDPNSGRESTEGGPLDLSHLFPGRQRRRFAGIRAGRAALTPRDPIASPHFFPGASAQNLISNSKRMLLNLVNSLQNVENSENCNSVFLDSWC
jgi:hypothetical protein